MQVLKYEMDRQPYALGSSVFGYNDAYAKLHPALRKWRAGRTSCGSGGCGGGSLPAMHIVSADVSRAFDCVDAGKLLEIVEPLFRSPEYLIVKHFEVTKSSPVSVPTRMCHPNSCSHN